MTVALNLRPILVLGFLHAVCLKGAESFFIRCLELEYVGRLGCLGDTRRHAVHAPAEMPVALHHTPLPAGVRVHLPYRAADRSKVRDKARLLVVAGVEQAQQPALLVDGAVPAASIPKRKLPPP